MHFTGSLDVFRGRAAKETIKAESRTARAAGRDDHRGGEIKKEHVLEFMLDNLRWRNRNRKQNELRK